MTFWGAVTFWLARGLVAAAGLVAFMFLVFIFLINLAYYERWRERQHQALIPPAERCPLCHGTGRILAYERCHACLGTGRKHHFV